MKYDVIRSYWPAPIYSDGSTLDLDFTTGTLDSRLTFTRSGTGTYINSSGYVTTASTNVARFDYDPATLAPRGLLIEGQTQNVLFYSQDVTQASRWTIQGGIPSSYTSVSATGGTAPDNTNTANLCTESTANNSRSIYQGLTAAAGTYTASVWVKAGTGSTRYIRIVIASAAGNFVYVTVNISTGAVTQAAAAVGTASAASATVTPYPGSWYHIRLTGTLAAALNFVFIVPLDSATPSVNTSDYGREAYLGNGSTFLIWGAQLELGSSASSYIPTGASQVTRVVDSLTMTGTNFSSWFNSAEGTFLAEFQTLYSGQTTDANSLLLLNSDANKRIMYFNTSSETMSTFDGTTILIAVGDVTGSIAKCASTYTSTARSIVSNGGTVTTGAVVAGYSTASSLGIGLTNPKMLIRKLKFYPTALPNANIQTLTTL